MPPDKMTPNKMPLGRNTSVAFKTSCVAKVAADAMFPSPDGVTLTEYRPKEPFQDINVLKRLLRPCRSVQKSNFSAQRVGSLE